MTARWRYWLDTVRLFGPVWAAWGALAAVAFCVLLAVWVFWTVLVRDIVLDARMLSGWPAWGFGTSIGAIAVYVLVQWLGDGDA